MKVTEIKELIEQGRDIGDIIQIKQYISFVEKKLMCENIINTCLIDNNGILSCDIAMKKLSTDMAILTNYCDIEFGDKFIEEYDWLCEQGIVKYVNENMNGEERYFIFNLIYEGIEEQIRSSNSVEAILSRGINKLIDKLPNDKQIKSLIKVASKEMKNFDPQKFEQIQQMLKVVK